VGALRIAAAALALIASSPAAADPVDRWSAYVEEASTRFGVPVVWIERVMRAESGGQTTLNGQPITSPAGAMGLMQLMPGTWAAMRARLGLGADPHQPRDNIMAGVAYLRLMYDRFGYPGLFGAYNAGPGRYAEHLATGRPLPGETRAYIASVGGAPRTRVPVAAREPSGNPMFFALRPATPPQPHREPASSADALFVIRR
jgi:soluble lytic murein transglycosylase-like protein